MRLRVGLTGGIGSGKTTVGARFAENGALLIDTDELAREAVAPGSDAFHRILERWPAARAADGSLDRSALARIVFGDAAQLAELNAIVHPFVRRRAMELEAASAEHDIAVHDVPLLFETGYDRLCDATVVVIADPAVRIARTIARSALSADEVHQRMTRQIEPERAAGLATFTVHNDGTLDELRQNADAVWGQLQRLARQG
ncbi:MAG: dephospho-CoA kinase [Candidatus Eremiobacteraeota bacterium]|nr:dephospho-CoA kinase [Candidatus Eremiobacteraeota bacterium]